MEIDPIDLSEPASFRITVDGVPVLGAVSITGLALEVEKIEFKQQTADGKFIIRELPGRVLPGAFSVRMPLSSDRAFLDWFAEVSTASADARRVVVLRLDGPTGEAIRTWTFSGCWCDGYAIDALSEGRAAGATLTASIRYDEAVVS